MDHKSKESQDKRRITNIYLLTFSFSSSFPLNRNKKEEEEKVKEKVKGDPDHVFEKKNQPKYIDSPTKEVTK